MAKLFKVKITRYLDATGKRRKADTPGAHRVEEQAENGTGGLTARPTLRRSKLY